MFETRKVGRTAVSVTSMSLGCAPIGNLYRAISEDAADEVLSLAWERGIRYFDVAPHYGRGLAEQRLGRFLAGRERASFAVSTKVGRVLRPGVQRAEVDGFISPLPNDVHYDYSAAGFAESLAGSRQRLGTDYLDIIYVHDIGRLTHGAANDRHMADLLESGLPYLREQQKLGHIGAIGLGVNEVDVCLEIMRDAQLDVILLAGRWTLLDRTAEERLVPLCHERGTSLVLGGIFNSGILATGPGPDATFDYAPASALVQDKVSALQKQYEALGVSLARAALMFGLLQPGVSSVLIGTAKSASLARNLDDLEKPLPEEALAALQQGLVR